MAKKIKVDNKVQIDFICIEGGNMNKVIIRQSGWGQGSGEEVEVLAREEIEKIIGEINPSEAFRIAHEQQHPGYRSGYAAISLITGKLIGFGLSQGESFQACDNNHIVVYRVDQNFELVCGKCDEIPTDKNDCVECHGEIVQLDMYWILDEIDEIYDEYNIYG